MSRAAKWLGLAGLVLMAGGGLFYALSIVHGDWGLVPVAAGLALVALAGVIARRRVGASLASRSTRLGLGAGAAVLAVLAVVIFAGALSARHHLRWDLSAGDKHSLAPQSKQVLEKLEEPVTAYAFFREDQAGRQQAEALLDQYAYNSRRFTYRFVNPDRDPALANRYQVKSYGTVVLAAGDKEERVKLPEEQKLTNALIRLTRAVDKKVYFLKGHGERSIQDIGKDDYSELAKALEAQGYAVGELVLAGREGVPADAALVVAAGPRKALMPAEKERLAAFLAGGGGLLLMIDPGDEPGLAGWLAERGVELAHNVVIDTSAAILGASPAWPVSGDFGHHEVTNPMTGLACYFPLARAVAMAPKLPKGVTGTELVKTSAQSWAAKDLEVLQKDPAQLNPEEFTPGPFSLAVAATVEGERAQGAEGPPPRGRLIVIGDADFASNTHLDQLGNRDLALNSVSHLAQEKDLVSLSPKQQSSQPLLLQPFQARLVFWLPVVVVPAVFVVIGLAVVWRRRRPA
jgi:ABC-type uncharacterized transport system involved in gliding motility auxiliary subunit